MSTQLMAGQGVAYAHFGERGNPCSCKAADVYEINRQPEPLVILIWSVDSIKGMPYPRAEQAILIEICALMPIRWLMHNKKIIKTGPIPTATTVAAAMLDEKMKYTVLETYQVATGEGPHIMRKLTTGQGEAPTHVNMLREIALVAQKIYKLNEAAFNVFSIDHDTSEILVSPYQKIIFNPTGGSKPMARPHNDASQPFTEQIVDDFIKANLLKAVHLYYCDAGNPNSGRIEQMAYELQKQKMTFTNYHTVAHNRRGSESIDTPTESIASRINKPHAESKKKTRSTAAANKK